MYLNIDNLAKAFDNKPLFSNVSLQLNKGETGVLCGPSGEGKTTLLRIISGLERFQNGRISIGKYTIQSNSKYPKELYGKVGMIFQNHNLFPHLSVLQNITLPLIKVQKYSKKEAREKALYHLEKMNIADLMNRAPASLSGGERQRASIARTLSLEPLLILLDEPTSNLDPFCIDDLLEVLESLAKTDTTLLMVTHNINLAIATGSTYMLMHNNTLKSSNYPNIFEPLQGKYHQKAKEKMENANVPQRVL